MRGVRQVMAMISRDLQELTRSQPPRDEKTADEGKKLSVSELARKATSPEERRTSNLTLQDDPLAEEGGISSNIPSPPLEEFKKVFTENNEDYKPQVVFRLPNETFVCEVCGKVFSRKGNLNQHIKRVHQKERQHQCDICGKAFVYQYELTQHVNRVHEKIGAYTCEICGKGFPKKSELERHRGSHAKPWICSTCGKRFSDKNLLNLHRNRVHLKLKPFICDQITEDGNICGKRFVRKSELMRHINAVHKKRRSWVCDICSKKFKTYSSLWHHQKSVHEKVRPYTCEKCGKSFYRKEGLQKHVQEIHLKLKPWVCDVCGERFPSKGNLMVHIRGVHKNKRPHICDWILEDGEPCGKQYKHKVDLQRHVNIIHKGLKPYICTKCGRVFGRKNDKDRHEKKCIPDLDEVVKIKYHIAKGANVESTVAGIFEDNFGSSKEIICGYGAELNHPTLGTRITDIYCDGLEGKRIAIDITTSNDKYFISRKWVERRYQDYPEVDEFWVIIVANDWDKKRCDKLTRQLRKNPKYRNVYLFHWMDLRNEKMMKIPPKIWKMLETYEKCNFKNVEQCKTYWEEVKEDYN